MRKTLSLLLLIIVSVSSFSQSVSQKIDELIQAYAKLGKYTGTVLVTRRDTVLLDKGYGYKNIKSNTKNSSATIFQIGSVTKQFTSAIILKLVELGKLSLDDKLSKFYPDYPAADSITISQLLSHTAGVFNYTNDNNFMRSEAVKPADEKKILAIFKAKPLDFTPGTKWSYSNSGYSLLGYVIEKVMKMPYEQIVRQYIFMPLNMNASGFDFAHLSNPEKATGYFAMYDTAGAEAPIVDSSVAFAAGSIYTTTGDLYKWHRGLLSGRVVRPESLEKAFTPVRNNYGYGWIIDSINNKRRVSHGGGIFGFSSSLTLIPEDDIMIVSLSNVNSTNFTDIGTKIQSIIYRQPYTLPQAKVEIQVSDTILQRYPGHYQVSPQFSLVITLENGSLMVQPTAQPKLKLYAQKENLFFIKEDDIDIEFAINETGKVDKLFLYQRGQKIAATKQ